MPPLKEQMELNRWLVAIPLAYATYTTITCPCDPYLLSCHLPHFYLSVGLPLVYVYYINS